MNADQHGFLIPDRRLSFDESVPTLKGIKRDTSTVIRLLKGQVRSNVLQQARRTNPNASAARVASIATPGAPSAAQAARGGSWSDRPRDGRGRFVAAAQRAGDPIEQAVRQLTRQQGQQVAVQQRAAAAAANQGGARQEAAAAQARDARGRFGAGGGRDDGGERGIGKDGVLARLKGAFPSHVGGDLEKIDPAIEAANELRSLASGPLKTVGVLGKAVLGRGLKAEKQDVAVPWYRRILGQLKIMRREDRADGRSELSAIKEIRAGGGGDSGGMMSALAGLLPTGLQGAAGGLAGLLKLAGKTSLPLAAILSAGKSYFTSTEEYADRMGVKDDGSVGKGLAIRSAGVLGDLGNTLTFGLADKLGKSDFMNGAVDKASAGLSAARDWTAGKAAAVARLISTQGTTRTYERADGQTETRSGGTVSWRNNNPGNLKFGYAGSADQTVTTKRTKAQALASAQKLYGSNVIDLDQWGNAIFSTEAAGRAAQAQLLKRNHGSKTIEEMLPQYAVSDYSGRANPKAYAQSVYKTADAKGINLRGKKIADLSEQEMAALLDGMKGVESFKVGTAQLSGPAPSSLMDAPQLAAKSPLAPMFGDAAARAQLSNPISTPFVPAITAAPAVVAALSSPASITVPMSGAPALPQLPRADIPAPLNSKPPQVVTLANDAPVGQDVRDRRLAQIATGGVSGD